MSSLQHLALIASLQEVASKDEQMRRECIEALGPECFAAFLRKIFQDGDTEKCNEWLRALGTSFSEYLDYGPMFSKLETRAMTSLEDGLERVKFDRGKFCYWQPCTKRTARRYKYCYQITGEFGGETGYFQPVEWNEKQLDFVKKEELTQDEENWLLEFPECVYHSGRPCYRNQFGTGEEDCECLLGREYGSFVLSPLNDV